VKWPRVKLVTCRQHSAANRTPLCSDGARCEVYESGGVERLATLLTCQLTSEPDSSRSQLARVACGFLFNLVNTHGVYAAVTSFCSIEYVLGNCFAKCFRAARCGSVAEWLACWTQAQKGLGSNRSRDAVG